MLVCGKGDLSWLMKASFPISSWALLRTKAGEGTDYLKKQGETLRESASEVVEKGKSTLGRQKDQLVAAVEAGKQAYRDAVAEDSSSGAKATQS